MTRENKSLEKYLARSEDLRADWTTDKLVTMNEVALAAILIVNASLTET